MDPLTLGVSLPTWADAAQTMITLTLDHPILGPIPFTLSPTDEGAGFDTASLFARVVAAGGIAPYVAPLAPVGPAVAPPVAP